MLDGHAKRENIPKMTTRIPVALFTYNRPNHVRRALAALENCARLDECRIHIYCDGPKSPEQSAAVDASRRIVRECAPRMGAEVVERSLNLGLACSVVTGVTELCQRYGRAVVLEDDFVVSPDFLSYMLEALDRYQDAPGVYQISGYMFPTPHPPKPDAFFLPLTTTRGWATWERAWSIFDWNAAGADEQLADPQTRKRFDLDDSYPYFALLKKRLSGQDDSWGILWWYAVFRAGGLVLHPRRSLVWVGGFDGSGTHWGKSPDFRQPEPETFAQISLSRPLVFPEKIAVDEEAFDRIKTFIYLEMHSQQSLSSRIQRRVKRYFEKSGI